MPFRSIFNHNHPRKHRINETLANRTAEVLHLQQHVPGNKSILEDFFCKCFIVPDNKLSQEQLANWGGAIRGKRGATLLRAKRKREKEGINIYMGDLIYTLRYILFKPFNLVMRILKLEPSLRNFVKHGGMHH